MNNSDANLVSDIYSLVDYRYPLSIFLFEG